MKNITKKQKIIFIILAVIIIAGIAVISTIGFNLELKMQETKKIELYIQKDFEISDIKNIVKEVIPDESIIIQKVEVFEDSVSITAKDITDEQKHILSFRTIIEEDLSKKTYRKKQFIIDEWGKFEDEGIYWYNKEYQKDLNFYFDEIVDESINETKNFAKLHQIDIKFIVEDTIEFNGYSNLLKIAIKNILKNAIQFSYKNSQVIVKNYKKDGFFNISVQDFGIGIAKNEQIKIFEKFYRTDKSRNKNSGGTGLGMSILKKIVDIHKGEITIKSEENKEITVTLSFNNK